MEPVPVTKPRPAVTKLSKEEIDNFKKIVHESMIKPKTLASVDYDNESTRKFTESVGRAPNDVSMSNVDRLAQARAAQILAPSNNTIH